MANAVDIPTLHGSAVLIGNKGVLIQGKSGSGKSTMAHALIAHAQSNQMFAQWVGDDQLRLQRGVGAVIAHAAQNISGKAEQAFNGIIEVPHTPSARIDLIVHLCVESELERMPERFCDSSFPELEAMRVPRRTTNVSVPLVMNRLNV